MKTVIRDVEIVRREHHGFALLEAFANEPHLEIESLHPILASQHALRILVVHHLCMTNFAHHNIAAKIEQSIRVQRGIGLFALRTYIPFVFDFL